MLYIQETEAKKEVEGETIPLDTPNKILEENKADKNLSLSVNSTAEVPCKVPSSSSCEVKKKRDR